MTIIITLLLSVVIVIVMLTLFRSLKTPYYRVDRQKIITTLEMVLTGQATENEWFLVFGMGIRHSPELEEYRQQCLQIEEKYYIGRNAKPHLFSRKGLEELKKVLTHLKNNRSIES